MDVCVTSELSGTCEIELAVSSQAYFSDEAGTVEPAVSGLSELHT